LRKLLYILLLLTFYSVLLNAQDTINNSKRKSFYSASLNVSLINDGPEHYLLPLIEYHKSNFEFYIGPIVSEKVYTNFTILYGGIPHTITISGLFGGCKYTFLGSNNHKIYFTLNANSGYTYYNYIGYMEHQGLLDGPFHNTYSTLFIGLSPGLSFKIQKRFFITFQIGSGIKYNVIKKNYVSFKESAYLHQGLFYSQLGFSYRFLK
jgi:hypothetical protein